MIPADPSATESSYFSGLAVRRELPLGGSGVERFPTTRMGRSLLWCDVGGWLVCTAHLESERESSVERIRQLRAIVARLEAFPGPAVFAGDTNLRTAEEPSVAGLDRVIDAWQALGCPVAGATTWFGSKARARYDRVVANARVRPVKLATIGTAPVPEAGVRPSDHLGLLATLERDGVGTPGSAGARVTPARERIGLALLLVVVGLVYLPGLAGQATDWDDPVWLGDPIFGMSLGDAVTAAFTTTRDHVYPPLLRLSFWLLQTPFAIHAATLGLYLGAIAGIHRIVRRLGVPSVPALVAMAIGRCTRRRLSASPGSPG